MLAAVTDSRSYQNIATQTDHRLVIMNIRSKKLTSYYKKPKNEKQINFERIHQLEYQKQYHDKVKEKLNETIKPIDIQQQWDRIININKETAIEIFGRKENINNRKYENAEITSLSTEQKQLRNKIESCNNKEKRIELRKERNKKLNEIKKIISINELNNITKKVEELEQLKNDSRKMFQSINYLKNRKPSIPLLIENKEKTGITANTEDQIEQITNFFKNFFNNENEEKIKNIQPLKMKSPFTTTEVQKAIASLKNNKSPGIDDLRTEQLKYGPIEISKEIADIFNHIAETGEKPKEITLGILNPLQKPGKKQGPCSNLRPIILLPTLRKILAICMVRRIGDRIMKEIPPSQAAYQAGRSTTEQVFVFRSMAEKAITSNDYTVHVLMMDMSKAFDTVKRNTLLSDLENILQKDELHIIKLLIEDVNLIVRCGNTYGKTFNTNTGIPQGDCLSPIFFILYLAKALKNEKDLYEQPIPTPQKSKFNYIKPTKKVLDPKYADDTSWITNGEYHIIENIKNKIPNILEKRGLIINEDKTEEYKIKYTPIPKKNEKYNKEDWEWKKCKILGSLIDTTKDFRRRKSLALYNFQNLQDIWNNTKITTHLKHRIFNSLIKPIFMYNSEIWSTSEKMESQINQFQRRLLRYMINVKWPQKISTEELRKKIKFEDWSKEISIRRLTWCGHLLRLPPNCPAQITLKLLEEPTRTTRSKRSTWLPIIKKQLSSINISWEQAKELALDRTSWREIIEHFRKSQC